jgi:hypothetical protein
MKEYSQTYHWMLALARAGIRRVWLDDALWCVLAREVSLTGVIEGVALEFYGTGLMVYPRCRRRNPGGDA